MICSNTRPLLHRSEDLIFADVRLRDVMEGIDLARKVKMRWPLLPVILTSGHPRERVGELPPGVGYMPKPLAAAQSADRYRNKHWHRGFDAPALAQFAPSRCRDQLPKRPVMQSHGITLSFHREMADSARELVRLDGSAAVTLESYPRFIKGGFQNYEGLGIKRSTADSKHVPSIRSRLPGTRFFGASTESSRIFGINWNFGRLFCLCKAPRQKTGNDERKGHGAELTNC